ncbi:MAG: VanZ family protein [Candidatus Omnitrophica bacterium]|nr:VanZ family protein [Candidatus Omnitrophota bacterium]
MKYLNKVKWIAFTLGYVVVILLLSFRPQSTVKHSVVFEVLYNGAHIPLYGVLGYFLLIVFKYLRFGKMAFFATIACGIIVGFIDEFFQSFVPGRTSSVMDVCLDVIGICVGMLVFKFLRTIMKKLKTV